MFALALALASGACGKSAVEDSGASNGSQTQPATTVTTTTSVDGAGRSANAAGDAAQPGSAGDASQGAGTSGAAAAGSGKAGSSAAGAAAAAGGAAGAIELAGAGGKTGTQPAADGGSPGADAGAADAAMPGADAGAVDDLCDVGVSMGQMPLRPQLSGDTFAHDPTMIEVDGTYYRFWTGERIPVASSRDLMRWTDASPVYQNGYPAWSREWLAGVPGQTFNFPWAPDASHFGGKYHLYASFSAKFGDNISCITHLTTSDVGAGDWTDHGPVICTKGDEAYNAIDPDVGFDTDGKPYLAFGSFWDGIMAFPLDENGDRVGTTLTRLAWNREIEAPVLFRRCGYYYLFVSWGLCCPGQNRSVDQLTYRVAVGRSQNILGPYVDRDGVKMTEGGGTVIVRGDSTFAAAGHSDVIVSDGHIYNIYHAYRRPRGDAELRIVEMLFDDEGWPISQAP